ncbi:MAG: farnesyl diphosphate synthase [Pseudomonadota bacterium]|nr:farnesyl diphosphate synthase [Pseudomonadota bacterium]
MTKQPFQQMLEARARRLEIAAQRWLPSAQTLPARLHEAMRYAVLGGGKRLRPQLVYASGQAVGLPLERLDAVALAVELIHAYSLVHDDLPAMDDDDLRRGQPTTHKAFDEATAILAGDALQPLAFEILATDPSIGADAPQRLAMVSRLAQAAGSQGMVGGQAVDLQQVGQQPDLDTIDVMHGLKTGRLILAATLLPCDLAGTADTPVGAALETYASRIGLAFQIHDDVLDETAETAVLGKTQGADRAAGKPTYPALMGLDASRQRARELIDAALEALQSFGPDADGLRALAHHMIQRSH